MNNQEPPDKPTLTADLATDDSVEVALRVRLELLRNEHHQLDEAIKQQSFHPSDDELCIRRMKKRKLLLKDSIRNIEKMLDPDPDECA
jgi:hypothetical protein